jgi:DNA-binding beta-propeller fold protein YncE
MAISPEGGRIYVTARGDNSVLAFDTGKLLKDADHARVGKISVGNAPVPVAVVDHGKKVVVGASNRFSDSTEAQSLLVIDAAKLPKGTAAVIGRIPVGAFPREMTVSTDGRTLFLTNFGSNSLQVIDAEHLPLAPADDF